MPRITKCNMIAGRMYALPPKTQAACCSAFGPAWVLVWLALSGKISPDGITDSGWSGVEAMWNAME